MISSRCSTTICKNLSAAESSVPEVDSHLLKGMIRRAWPNNVRELANAAELYAVGYYRSRIR